MQMSDPKAIRALAHPIRLDLLELLTAISPATAARCGRILGVSQASCSFHLRQLAKYGFVEEAEPGRDRRERLWRVTVSRSTLRVDDSVDPIVAHEFERVAVQREAQTIIDFLARRGEETAQWREGAGGLATVVALSPDEAVELKQKWRELLAPYVARTEANGYQPGPGQRFFRHFMAATPLPTFDMGASEDGSDD